jgi:hypothetical protein
LKQCATCGEFKSLDQFNWRNREKGYRWGTCKDCQSQQRKAWYERNKDTHIANAWKNKVNAREAARQYVWDYLSSHPCIDCGETNPVVLEFDHVRGRKKKAVADLVREGYSIAAIQNEISKCDVRCANCHRIRTHKKRGWWRAG